MEVATGRTVGRKIF